MTDLPPGWEWTTLGEIGDYVNGRGFKKDEWSTRGRPIVRIQNLTGTSAKFNYFDGDVAESHLARRGDLLMSWAASLGVYRWDGPEAAVNQHIFKVQSKIEQSFHKLVIANAIDNLKESSHGTGMVHVTRPIFEATHVPLPPTAEQRRIVEEVEHLLKTTDEAARAVGSSLDRSTAFAETCVREALYPSTASTGASAPPASFTADGDLPSIPDGWSWQRLDDVAEVVGGVTKDSSKQTDPHMQLVPYLRVANVQRGRLELSEVAHIRATQRQVDKLTLRPGDVLLNEGGDRDKLGRGWVWEGQIEDCIHQNHVFRARVRDGVIHPKLLAWHANNFGRWFERNGKQSVNLASISLTTIRQLPVPVPPRELQHEIVARIESALATCGRLQGAAADAITRVGALRASILRAAFAGELTYQDPTDEPAAVLLERIHEERAATSARRRPSRSPTR